MEGKHQHLTVFLSPNWAILPLYIYNYRLYAKGEGTKLIIIWPFEVCQIRVRRSRFLYILYRKNYSCNHFKQNSITFYKIFINFSRCFKERVKNKVKISQTFLFFSRIDFYSIDFKDKWSFVLSSFELETFYEGIYWI